MFRAILWKAVCCDVNEDLLHTLHGSLFYRGVSHLWCIWSTFIVLCIVVVIFLCWGLFILFYLFYDIVWLVKLFVCSGYSCITLWSGRGECVFFFLCFVSCTFYVVHVEYIRFYSLMT